MKKKLNIVLLVLVLSLWGTVIYKYVKQYFIKNEALNFTTATNYTVKNEILKKDTFEMKKIDKDPFLGNYTGEVKVVIPNSNAIKKDVKKEPQKAIYKALFPSVSYYGYIKSIDKSQELVLLSVDGKFSRLHLNQDRNGLQVTVLNKDSIKVCYNNESKWFRLKKK